MANSLQRATAFGTQTAFLVIAQQVTARATRDALFLDAFEAERIPQIMFAAAVFSLLGALVSGRLIGYRGPVRAVQMLAALSALFFVGEAALLPKFPQAIAALNYVHATVLGAILISAFWSIVNEMFDPYTAKKKIARITSGAALGGLMGGGLAYALAKFADIGIALITLAILNVGFAASATAFGASSPQRDSTAPRLHDPEATLPKMRGFATLANVPYLRRIGFVVLTLSAASALLGFALKAAADARYQNQSDLLGFFATFYMATGFLTFAAQSGVSKPMLRHVGLVGTLSILPVAILLAGGSASIAPEFLIIAVAVGVESVLANSLFRSGYELLYIPVAPEHKRPTKPLIDVGFDKAGDGLGSLLIIVLLPILASIALTLRTSLAIAAALGVVALLLILRIGRGYVAQLATSLRTGAVDIRKQDLVDATSLKTYAESATSLDRDQILRAIEDLKRDQKEADWWAQLEALRSGDRTRILATLLEGRFDPRVVPSIVALLKEREFQGEARRALTRNVDEIIGQLTDSLLRSGTPQVIRRRIPAVLAEASHPRALNALLAGLDDESFDVRYRCSHAAALFYESHPDTRVPSRSVLYLIERELERKPEGQDDLLQLEPDETGHRVQDAFRDRADRWLEHIFALLTLVLDGNALVTALRALNADEEALRGTALEYLDQVLPQSVRDSLWPQLVRAKPTYERSGKEPNELLKSMHSLVFDVDDLP